MRPIRTRASSRWCRRSPNCCAIWAWPRKLVGRTGFCIHPADVVQAIPKVGGTKDVNIEKIRKLAPTHLVVNIDENEKPTVDLLANSSAHRGHPSAAPRDNLALARLMGGVFCREQQAADWCAAFRGEYTHCCRPCRQGAAADDVVLHLAGPVDDGVARYLYRAHAGRNRLERAGSGRECAIRALTGRGTGGRHRRRAAVDRALSLYRGACGCAGKAARQAGAAGRWGNDVVVWQPVAAGAALLAGAGAR
jgi:hypothetical protein